MTVQHFELLDIFLSAYEICRDRRAALERGECADSPQALDALGRRLKSAIQASVETTCDQGEDFRQALARTGYALAALVDEQLIHDTEWCGKSRWTDQLLERRLYRSSLAGRRLFIAIESLPGERWPAPLKRQMALVYLMVLQLGFRGELRGEEERRTPYLQQLQQQLQSLAPDAESALPERACAQAYAHNIEPASAERLAPLSHWMKRMLLLAGLYLLASTAVWLVALAGFMDFRGP